MRPTKPKPRKHKAFDIDGSPICESDGVVSKTFTTNGGRSFAVTHCKYCRKPMQSEPRNDAKRV